MAKEIYSIALDGPAGAGKSTVAKLVAKQLGLTYIDTGAMYRTAAYIAITTNLSSEVDIYNKLIASKIDFFPNGNDIIVDGVDISSKIRTPEISRLVPIIAGYSSIRTYMRELQQEVAHKHSSILDGRDIGTMVLPDAMLKIYMIADVDIRAKRRHDELIAKGENIAYETIRQDVIDRDDQDYARSDSPLKKANDAVELDSSHLTPQECADRICDLFHTKTNVPKKP